MYLKAKTQNQILAQGASGKEYVFSPRNGISIGEVDDNDVPDLLRRKCGCCGNERPCFSQATQEEVELWRK